MGDSKVQSILRQCHKVLVDKLRTEHIIDDMFQQGLISQDLLVHLPDEKSSKKTNRKLLEHLRDHLEFKELPVL